MYTEGINHRTADERRANTFQHCHHSDRTSKVGHSLQLDKVLSLRHSCSRSIRRDIILYNSKLTSFADFTFCGDIALVQNCVASDPCIRSNNTALQLGSVDYFVTSAFEQAESNLDLPFPNDDSIHKDTPVGPCAGLNSHIFAHAALLDYHFIAQTQA